MVFELKQVGKNSFTIELGGKTVIELCAKDTDCSEK